MIIKETNPDSPTVCVLPYLWLTESVEFCGWWLGPLNKCDRWQERPDLRDACEEFVDRFHDASARPITHASLLCRSSTGVDGVPPTREEAEALRLAVAFCVLHKNPFWTEGNRDDSLRVATTDNADLWIQPLDLQGGQIVVTRGRRVETRVCGRVTDDRFSIPAPLELHLPGQRSLDKMLLEATYGTVLSATSEKDCPKRQLSIAIRWFLKSWQNSASLTAEDQLVFLKTAIEALTGKSGVGSAANTLHQMFGDATTCVGLPPADNGLLWKPDEPQLAPKKRSDRQTHTQPQFVHWATEFGDVRNMIIHGDPGYESDASLKYQVQGSAYNGPIVETAERIAREAILVKLMECGFPHLWLTPIKRSLAAASDRSPNTQTG